jgi:hypothetical protein
VFALLLPLEEQETSYLAASASILSFSSVLVKDIKFWFLGFRLSFFEEKIVVQITKYFKFYNDENLLLTYKKIQLLNWIFYLLFLS